MQHTWLPCESCCKTGGSLQESGTHNDEAGEDEKEEAAQLRGEKDRSTDERRVGAIVRDS